MSPTEPRADEGLREALHDTLATVAFLRSVVASGERLSDTDNERMREVYDKARAALTQPATASREEGGADDDLAAAWHAATRAGGDEPTAWLSDVAHAKAFLAALRLSRAHAAVETTPAGLDVEALAEAMYRVLGATGTWMGPSIEFAPQLAAEYDRILSDPDAARGPQ